MTCPESLGDVGAELRVGPGFPDCWLSAHSPPGTISFIHSFSFIFSEIELTYSGMLVSGAPPRTRYLCTW